MVPVLELTMEAIDIWNETGARMCDIELRKRKDETACAVTLRDAGNLGYEVLKRPRKSHTDKEAI